MIEACFDTAKSRCAAVSGAYQYDTGQRLRMHGLPTPEELTQTDDFLEGDELVVQAQYSFAGDMQTEMRRAEYDEEEDAWIAEIPNAYLTRSAPVHVYVYVLHGQTETQLRAKTLYEAAFTPAARPVPSALVTEDQLNTWDVLVREINLTLASLNTALSGANAAAEKALEAEQSAKAAEVSARKWADATAQAKTLEPGSEATVSVTEEEGRKVITYGIPRGDVGPKGEDGARGEKGDRGEKGEKGDAGPRGETGPAGVTFTLQGSVLYIVRS